MKRSEILKKELSSIKPSVISEFSSEEIIIKRAKDNSSVLIIPIDIINNDKITSFDYLMEVDKICNKVKKELLKK